MKTTQRSPDFRKTLLKELREPEFAALYLNEHAVYQGKLRQELLLEALMDVIEVHGVSGLAEDAGLSRRTLYAAFSKSGNPRLQTLLAVLEKLGIGLKFTTRKGRRSGT